MKQQKLVTGWGRGDGHGQGDVWAKQGGSCRAGHSLDSLPFTGCPWLPAAGVDEPRYVACCTEEAGACMCNTCERERVPVSLLSAERSPRSVDLGKQPPVGPEGTVDGVATDRVFSKHICVQSFGF